jgi:hypothetical protein
MKKNLVLAALVFGCGLLVGAIAVAEENGSEISLPAALQSVVKDMFPNAQVTKVEKEKKCLELYEVDLKDGAKESSMVISEQGVVESIETVIPVDSLPKAVADAAAGAKIKKAEKEVIQAKPQLVKLDSPETVYEIEFVKDGKEIELNVSADGKILKQKIEKEENEKKEAQDKD